MIAALLFIRTWRLEIEVFAVVVVSAVLTFWVINHLEGIGAVKCEAANTDARVAELVRDATARTNADASIREEASIYAQTLAAPLGAAPVFAAPGLCVSAASSSVPRRMPAAAAAGSDGHGAAALSGNDRGRADDDVRVQTLRNAGRQADAQVIELQSYIRDVCRASAAN